MPLALKFFFFWGGGIQACATMPTLQLFVLSWWEPYPKVGALEDRAKGGRAHMDRQAISFHTL